MMSQLSHKHLVFTYGICVCGDESKCVMFLPRLLYSKFKLIPSTHPSLLPLKHHMSAELHLVSSSLGQ